MTFSEKPSRPGSDSGEGAAGAHDGLVHASAVVPESKSQLLDDATLRRYTHLVRGYCRRRMTDESAAEDAAQETLARFLERRGVGIVNAEAWLIAVADRVCRHHYKMLSRRVAVDAVAMVSEDSAVQDPARLATDSALVADVIHRLRPLDRLVLGWLYMADRSAEQLAAHLKMSEGNVRVIALRARRRARELLTSMNGRAGVPALLLQPISARLGRLGHHATELSRRARNGVRDASTELVAQPAQGLVLSLTLTGLAVSATSPTGFAAFDVEGVATGAAPMAARPGRFGGLGADGSQLVGYPGSAAPGRYASTQTTPSTPYHPAGPMGLPVIGGGPGTETPEDATIVSAAPSPHYAQDHTIVAIGTGHRCGCSVTLISHDGGATWTPGAGPPSGDEVVLPPEYPNDPQIFVGYRYSAAQTFDYVAPEFGAEYNPLTLPPGVVALSAGFDHGDPRVFSATSSGLWSLNIETRVVEALIVDTHDDVTPSMATPRGAQGVGVLAVSTSAAFTPGAPDLPHGTDPTTVWQCPPGQVCTALARLSLPEGATVAASPDFVADGTVIAYDIHRVLVSVDRGRSFRDLSLPPAPYEAISLALGPADTIGPSLWLLQQIGTSSFRLEMAPAPGAPWREVDHGNSVLTSVGGQIVPVSASRALYLAVDGGFLCTADAGETWATRCQPA